MAVGDIILPSDVSNTGKREATRTKTDTDGVVKNFPRSLIENPRANRNELVVSTFRTIGSAALLHNLFSLENQAGSGIILAVRRMTVQLDATAVLITVAPSIKVSRPTALPTGGTPLTKGLFDTRPPASPATVVARGANASDGGAATAIIATAGAALWSQYAMRLHTAVGQVVMEDQSILPALCESDPVLLNPGEALLAQVISAPATSNPVTNHWIVNCMFEEFTEF